MDNTGEIIFDEGGNPCSDDYLFMDGLEVFNYRLSEVPRLVEYTMMKNKISENGIDLYIFHQANKYMMEFLR